MTPTFTILLGVIRPPVALPYAIESVLAQTNAAFELFVVCDGAPSETIECARQYAARDPRVKVFDFPKGERIGEAHWHRVLEGARGRYVAHLEDDDLWFPNHLEEMEKLLETVDFGHVLHVWAKPDETFETLPFDLSIPQLRQRMLNEKFNRIGFSVCGYRLEAYRRLAEGWTPAPKDMFPDLHMWRKFLRRDDFRFGTRMAVTAVVLATGFRPAMPLEEKTREGRKWLDRILDEAERARIVEAAWRSVVNQQLRSEQDLAYLKQVNADLTQTNADVTQMNAGTQAKLEQVLNSTSWRITEPLRKAIAAIRHGLRMGR